MTLTADLLLLLYRIARLETQKKSSFHSLALLCIILMLILYFAPNSFCFSLRPRSAGKCRTQSVGLSFDSHHFCGLSPGEVDGKFRNGFQQWWMASFLRKQSPSPSAGGRQAGEPNNRRTSYARKSREQIIKKVGHCCHRSNSFRRPAVAAWFSSDDRWLFTQWGVHVSFCGCGARPR
jgi:hypothetical protein